MPSPDEPHLPGRTVRLSAPPHFRLLDLGAIADVVTTNGAERQMTTVYLDTADLRLVRWGAVLRHRAGEGWTVRPPAIGGHRHPDVHLPGDASAPPKEALELLTAVVRTARLRPVARLRTVRRLLTLTTHDGSPLAEIDDDEVTVLDGRRVAGRFREVDVDVVDGAPAELLEGILERLHAAGCGVVDPTPKLVHALGARALEPPEVVVADLGRGVAAHAVVGRAVAAAAVRLLERDPGLRTAQEPEDVHQARVATRRLRSDLRTLAPLVDAEEAATLRAELAWLADELGAVRDAEVMRDRLRGGAAALGGSDAAAGLRITAALDGTVTAARRELARALRSDRYVGLLDLLVGWAADPPLTVAADRPAVEVLPDLVTLAFRQLQRDVRRLGDEPEDEALHQVRIRAKRVRYAAEATAPVLGRRVAAVGRAAAGLQEVLGDFHDAIVAADWLRAHGTAGHDAFAAGRLCEAEMAIVRERRTQWPAAWKRLRKEWAAWT